MRRPPGRRVNHPGAVMVLVVILALSWFALSIPLALLVGRMLAGPPPERRTADLGARLDQLLA